MMAFQLAIDSEWYRILYATPVLFCGNLVFCRRDWVFVDTCFVGIV